MDFRINDLLTSLATTFGSPARCDVEKLKYLMTSLVCRLRVKVCIEHSNKSVRIARPQVFFRYEQD